MLMRVHSWAACALQNIEGEPHSALRPYFERRLPSCTGLNPRVGLFLEVLVKRGQHGCKETCGHVTTLRDAEAANTRCR